MITIAYQVSRAVRILRGKRDESARASHLMAKKGSIANNDAVLVGQAEREKFFQSTFFERKSMSTKTALKRVALVAAAALAIGGVTAVSAQATVGLSISTGYLGVGTTAGTAIAGPANSTSVTADATHREYVVITGGTFVGGTTAQILAANGSIGVNTPTVGTITVSGYQETSTTPNGIFSTTVSDTVTITVSAFAAGTLYGTSGVYLNSGILHSAVSTTLATSTNTTAALADAGVVTAGVVAASGATNVANFQVIEADPNGIPLTTGFVPVTATVTNGLLTASSVTALAVGTIPTSASTYLAGTPAAGIFAFTLSSLAGISGTSTVTISVNGVVVRTFAATFTGAAAKLVLTAINSVIGVTGTSGVGALKVQEFDANGNALAVPSLSLTSGTTTSIPSIAANAVTAIGSTLADGTLSTASIGALTIVGSAVGTSSITVADALAGLTSNAVSVRVSSAVPTAVVVTSDLAAYPAGGAGTLSYTLSDAAGTVPAGTYTVYTTAPSSSYALTVGTANLPGLTMTVNDAGVKTVAFNAPLSDGTTTVAGTTATGITETPVSFTVSSGASDAANAATDAANEATDAANAATDAANAAADSADAATQAAQDAGAKADAALAAVTALSQQVTSVLAKVAALSALLVRIVKKVKA